MPSSPSLPCRALKITSVDLLIKLKFLNFGSKKVTLYFLFLSAFAHALPVSILTALSPEFPPNTTKTFLNFFFFTYNFNL